MKTASHLATVALIAVAFAVLIVAPSVSASASQDALITLNHITAGVDGSHAFQIQSKPLRQPAQPAANSAPRLTCQPTPCILLDTPVSAGFGPVNETAITANPNNADWLLIGANDYNCFSTPGFFNSSDGGSSWKHVCMGALTGRIGVADPGLGYDLNNTAYITGLQGYVAGCSRGGDVVGFEKSSDNGASWSAPAVAVNPYFPNGTTDKDWLQIDTNASSPFANALYISATQFDDPCFPKKLSNSELTVTHSTDAGASWTTVPVAPEQFYPTVDELSDLAIGKDGTVYLSWERCTLAHDPAASRLTCGGQVATVLMSKSTDGGNTWTPASTVAQIHLPLDSCHCALGGSLPNTREQVYQVPAIDVDNSNGAHAGNLYTVMYNWTGKFLQVEVAHSADGGATWSAPVPVAPPSANHDQFYAWLSVSSDGTVGVTWLDRRNDPANLSYEAFAALSADGGVSFGDNYKLASAPSNPLNDGFKGTSMGDYTGNIWAGNTLYASWMDSRNGKNMQAYIGGYQK